MAAKGVAIYTPDGKVLDTIALKDLPSNCAFGEADLKSLFITARSKVYRARVPLKGAY